MILCGENTVGKGEREGSGVDSPPRQALGSGWK